MPRIARVAGPALAVLLLLAGCTGDGGRPDAGGGSGRAGAAGLRDPYFPELGNGGYDVSHYGLTLDYEPATGRLRGTARITARATQHLTSFHLDFTGMSVESVTVDGARAAVRRAGQELTVRPPEGLDEDRTFRTVVRYSGVPRRLTDPDGSQEGWLRSGDRAVALGEPAGSMTWFPGNHHPSDKAAYDIRITVPEGLRAVSNGELRSTRTTGGRTAFVWHCAEPMASYLATVAVGPYETKETRPRLGGGPGAAPVYTLVAVDPTVAGESAGLIAELPRIMEWEQETFGPYPFSSAGVIIGRPGDAGYALETQGRPFLPGPTRTVTLVHELAHQWFGNSLSPRSWRDMWLNEGFAQYAEWLWNDDMGQMPVRVSFAEAYEDERNWAFPPAVPPSAADLSGQPVYGRGAMVLHQLRLAVGDATFFRIVRGWARTHRHGTVSTADFTAYAERESGQDLGALWDGWLYGEGKPPRGGA